MENKKLLKFLYKDIAEIEELFAEKGADGFDEFEIEFIQSRFKGAKQVLQILSEKENKQLTTTRPRLMEQETIDSEIEDDEVLPSVEEKLEDNIPSKEEEEESVQPQQLIEEEEGTQSDLTEEKIEMEQVGSSAQELETKVEMEAEAEADAANSRLGDSFSKEKSVNELLGFDDSSKLEYKISNSPVASIKAAIGINDRYQYIRELFDGNGDVYTKAVSDLDGLNTIQEAVAYLQDNYKWKKNDTSLKFVSLVKRRFANG